MHRIAPLLLVAVLAGCTSPPPESDVAVASYPAAYVVEALAGDDLRVRDLGTGTPLHDFEPSTRDLDALRGADHLVLWDETVEAWAHRAESSLGRSAPVTWSLMRLPPGDDLLEPGHAHEDGPTGEAGHGEAEAGHGEDHATGHEVGHDEGHDDGRGDGAYDPHTWLDPLAMRESAGWLAAQLAAAYPGHADNITQRGARLHEVLTGLDAQFRQDLAQCAHRQIVTNHDAYAYLARRYGFVVHSLHGIEPGAEPAPETVAEAIRILRDLDLPVMFVEESTDPRVVRAIRDEADVEVRVLNTLETRPASGDYVGAQIQNLQNLRLAMGCA